MNDRDQLGTLERRLRATASAIEWPPMRDLSGSVRSTIEQTTAPSRRAPSFPRAAFGVALLILAVVGATLALFPGARSAVADWLGISGIEIRVRTDAPDPTSPVETIEDLDLGDETSVAAAQEAVDFRLRMPGAPRFGTPRVFVREVPVPAVSFVYPPGPALPRSQETGVGMLLTEFRGHYDPALVKKVSTTSTIEPVDLHDGGYWMEGRPHSVLFRDPEGDIAEDRIRLAGNTLVWEDDGVSYRLEADVEKAEALSIARSLD